MDFDENSDPAADFLAREQEILGDAAEDFQKPTDPSVTSAGVTSPPVGRNAGNDLFMPSTTSIGSVTSGSAAGSVTGAPAVGETGMGAFGAGNQEGFAVMDTGDDYRQTNDTRPSMGFEEEPVAIQEWREKFMKQIADHDDRLEQDHRETIERARREIDRFYDEYNEKKERAIQKNRETQKALLDEMERENESSAGVWERICRRLDLRSDSAHAGPGVSPSLYGGMFSKSGVTNSAKAGLSGSGANLGPQGSSGNSTSTAPTSMLPKDQSRMKQVLLSLKSDPNAPTGANHGLPAVPNVPPTPADDSLQDGAASPF